jgi:acetyl-CoA acetyltransferase
VDLKRGQLKMKMMINKKYVIDLEGPMGNPWYMIARSEVLAKSKGWHRKRIDEMIRKMQSDMQYAYRVFDEYFGNEYVIIEKYEE